MKKFFMTFYSEQSNIFFRFIGTPILIVLVTLFGLGGSDFIVQIFSTPQVAEAAYTGKHLRTVEFVLGGGAGTGVAQSGTDNFGTSRLSDVNVFAGTAWNATKGTAGTKTIAIPGTGIRVVSAYLDVTAAMINGVSVTDLELALDVSPGPAGGADINISQVARNGTGLVYTQTSSLASPILTAKANATALFQTQTDGEWNSGLAVVGMMSVIGPTWTNATMKLIITYEQDYSTSAHTELKTVRFPLTSTTTGDNGTKRSDCAIAATCSFAYALDIPDLAANADILDVWFEVSYVDNGATSATTTIGVAGGGTTAVRADDALTEGMERFVIYRPPVGSPDLLPNVSQKLDVVVAANAVGGLGGEVVVTYKYSTDAPVQTETVQYWIGQGTTLPGTASSSFAQLATITNGGADVRNLWYKVHAAVTATPAMNISTKVGSSASTTVRYIPTFSQPRGGALRIIQSVGVATTSFTYPSTLLSMDVRFEATTYDASAGVEAYITFRWSGSANGPVTKTAKFFGGTSGSVPSIGNTDNTIPYTVTLPESVTKTLRSSYLSTSVLHTNTGTITNGTIIISLSGQSAVTVTEATEDTENFHAVYVAKATESGFTYGSTIAWTTRDFNTIVRSNQSNEIAMSSEMVVTYDADLAGTAADIGEGKHLRTVEFVLGGGAGTAITQTGTDAGAVARASDANVYAGSAWNATKNTAGTKTVTIPGSGIRVVSAYLDVTSGLISASDVTDVEIALDVSPGPGTGIDISLSGVGRNGTTQIYVDSSGASSPIVSAKANATALFQTQTDSEWNSGVAVVGMLSITGPTWINATMKLIITYEEDYSLVPHTALKTVRFPLLSTTAGDSGTKRSDCAVAATCSFGYTLVLPDLATTSDIVDAWYEISYVDNASSSVTLSVNGGATGVQHAPLENLTDGMERFLIYRPQIGAPNFATSTVGQLDVAIATSAVGGLGGEVVVTYKYSTGAQRQMETVQYFMGQATALPGTASTSFARMATIANGSTTIKNIWFKVHDSVTTVTTNSTAIGGKIGSSATTTKTYIPTLTLARGGELRIIHDMGSATSSWTASSTLLSMDIRHNAATYDGPPGVEAFITFEWEGHLNGPVTKTAKFFAGSSGAVPALTNSDNSFPFSVTIPESVTKTLRSSYLSTSVLHTDATSILPGTVLISLSGGAPVTISEGTEDIENFRAIYQTEATSTNYTLENIIPWTTRAFQTIVRGNQTEEYAASAELVVTYGAELALKVPVLNQDYYRFYVDNDALLPTDPWPAGAAFLNENSSITPTDAPPDQGDRVRLRMSFSVATTTLLASTTPFTLQYGTPTSTCDNLGASWTNVGGVGSGGLWRGYNTAVTDETNLSTNPPTGGDLVLAQSDRAGTFEEANNTKGNPFAVAVGEGVEYDWVLEDNLAATNTPYCFRMAYTDGTKFQTYTDYPIIKTAGYSPETRNWRFYDDENNETPTTPLANENVAPVNIKYGDIQKLRITAADTRGHGGVNQKFRLQYSTYSDFSAQVYYVDSTTTCATLWCYADGGDSDDAVISSLLLTDSAIAGRHNEAPTTTSTIDPTASTAYEFEYTLKHHGASANTTYFFRLWDVNNDVYVPLGGGETYPSLSTGDTTLTFMITGTPVASSTEGILTTIATTPTTVPFGDLSIDVPQIGAHTLTVTTNAISGYQVFVSESQNFISAGGAEIQGFNASNTAPAVWATGCTPAMYGCFGYHAGDDSLLGPSGRFSVDDTWAEFEIPQREVMFANTPVASDTADMIYKVERHTLLPAGQYETEIRYVVVPTY
jgi:hypothetical protein